jgi:hypothetical protein
VPSGNVAPPLLVLRLDTHDPIGRELVVEAALDTAEEARVARLEAAVAGKGAADMAADVEAGPVVDHLRRRVGRSLGVGARLHVGCGSRRGQRKQGNRTQQNPFHDHPRSFKFDTQETTWRELGCFEAMPER